MVAKPSKYGCFRSARALRPPDFAPSGSVRLTTRLTRSGGRARRSDADEFDWTCGRSIDLAGTSPMSVGADARREIASTRDRHHPKTAARLVALRPGRRHGARRPGVYLCRFSGPCTRQRDYSRRGSPTRPRQRPQRGSLGCRSLSIASGCRRPRDGDRPEQRSSPQTPRYARRRQLVSE
jgi:hypothetical protein